MGGCYVFFFSSRPSHVWYLVLSTVCLHMYVNRTVSTDKALVKSEPQTRKVLAARSRIRLRISRHFHFRPRHGWGMTIAAFPSPETKTKRHQRTLFLSGETVDGRRERSHPQSWLCPTSATQLLVVSSNLHLGESRDCTSRPPVSSALYHAGRF